MNFQEARNLEGQKDGKGYQVGVDMVGTVMAIEPKKFTEQGKPSQQISIQDSVGEVQKVKIWLGNGPDILQTDIGTQQAFQQLAVNPFKGNIYYKAFWDNMHPPQGQAAPINAATQEIINRHREPKQAAEQIMNRMAGEDPSSGRFPTAETEPYPTPQPSTPTQEDYKAKEREKVIGMCMCGHVNARLVNTPPTELLDDKAQFAALWQIAIRIIDGTGQVQEGPNF